MDFIKTDAPLTMRFKDVTKEYGRAEFVICLAYRRGVIDVIHISSAQSVPEQYFSVKLRYKKDSLMISSYDGLDDAKVWLTGYCKEHKTTFMRLYVPVRSGKVTVDEDGLAFRRG
jgi:hypothetical protein